jgi:hypothetical protein
MNEKVENLILEHLRSLRADMARMSDDIRVLRVETTAIRQHMAAFGTLQEQDHTDIGAIKSRLDRIEKRLDLVE